MRKKYWPLLILFICIKATAAAEGYSGNKLYEHLQSKIIPEQNYGFFYILGIVDAELADINWETSTPYRRKMFCVPPDTTGTQYVDIVKKFLDAAPAIRHLPAIFLTRAAMTGSWPCPDNPK